MKYIIIIVMIICSPLLAAKNVFWDQAGNSLEVYDQGFKILEEFYKDNCPERIVVKYGIYGNSLFHTSDNSITLALDRLKGIPISTVIHETSHLCLNRLTRGRSKQTEFRFIDEGFACIIQNRVIDNDKNYRLRSFIAARIQLQKGNVDFKKVQNWKKYYGDYQLYRKKRRKNKQVKFKKNSHAYPVGSSFVYYIIDHYGEKKLFDFFVDMGKTNNLGKTIRNILGKKKNRVLKEWLTYIDSKGKMTPAQLTEPKIVDSFPQNEQKDVPIDIKEIYVKFNRPMVRFISLSTNCNSGICYKNAYWKKDDILAIRVSKKLFPGKIYRLSLGNKRRRKLKSIFGKEFPITSWEFTTSK